MAELPKDIICLVSNMLLNKKQAICAFFSPKLCRSFLVIFVERLLIRQKGSNEKEVEVKAAAISLQQLLAHHALAVGWSWHTCPISLTCRTQISEALYT